MHVQSFSGKFLGQCGLLHHKGGTGITYRYMKDYSCGASMLNNVPNGGDKNWRIFLV